MQLKAHGAKVSATITFSVNIHQPYNFDEFRTNQSLQTYHYLSYNIFRLPNLKLTAPRLYTM